ncbi:MAG: ATP-sensitive inward rectifier potassium channel 10 [Oscillatoriales cyanobacterium C42_A2020_001]|nr:ATP-sensitive inward rectifier potassium channel 10 [Leptolyngbyaceae cyanobacterium C42_A2020_001]
MAPKFQQPPPHSSAPKQQRQRFKHSRRVLSPDGRISILRLGDNYNPWKDLYHRLLIMSWMQFLVLVASLYVVTNMLFAGAYLIGEENIANARPGSLIDAFSFSIQTMATIGYGAMYPKTFYANILVAIEAFVGLLGVAMATGLMFARFSRPTARVVLSRNAVIMPYNGVPTLMFRAANKRGNQILEARLWVTLLREETTVEGHTMRRIYDMKLTRSHSPFFVLTWTAMHPIDEESPLYGETPESLATSDAEILISLTGIDETVAQTVHARYTYAVRNILWNFKFTDVVSTLPNGQRVIDYANFHDVEVLHK